MKDEGQENLSLVEYDDTNIPRYAILSHTWGADSEEVTFKDLMEGTGKNKVGYDKIDFCRKQAASDGLQHFWAEALYFWSHLCRKVAVGWFRQPIDVVREEAIRRGEEGGH
jgi:hypothetical protein